MVRREDVRESVRAKAEAIVLERMRTACYLALASYALFLLNDIVVGSEHLPVLLLIKVVQVAGASAVLVGLRDARARAHAVSLALGFAVFLAIAATISAVVRGNTNSHVLLLTAFAVGSATLFPWGTRPQAVLVVACLALVCGTFLAVDGTLWTAVTNPNIAALATAIAISLYIAADGERYRYQIEEHALGLQLRERHFRSLIEHGADFIVVLEPDGTIRYVSESVRPFLGYTPDDWVGTSLFDVVDPVDAPLLRELVAASSAPMLTPRSVEVRVRDSATSWHVLVGTVTNLLAEPAVRGIVFNAHDITLRKEVETELQRSEAALSALIESTPDGVWSVDRDGRVTAMNTHIRTAFVRLYGTDLRPGQRFDEILPAEEVREWRPLYERVFRGEQVTTERHFEDGRATRHYLVSMNPIRDGGRIAGAVVFTRDITDMRRTQELARRNQAELTHVLRMGTIGEIASSLAHEINQPLAAISNYAAACGRKLEAGADVQEVRRGLALIGREALRAGDIIRRLRHLARKGDETMEMVDLNALVQTSLALVDPEARMQHIAVESEAAADLPQLYIDPVQIEQVVLNLLLNAIESMQSSPVKLLSVRTARVEGAAQVSVRDTGSGLGATAVEDAFAPFFTTKATGLGMGLPISRRIVEAHGGQLTGVANSDGRGTTFAFTLPLPQ